MPIRLTKFISKYELDGSLYSLRKMWQMLFYGMKMKLKQSDNHEWYDRKGKLSIEYQLWLIQSLVKVSYEGNGSRQLDYDTYI